MAKTLNDFLDRVKNNLSITGSDDDVFISQSILDAQNGLPVFIQKNDVDVSLSTVEDQKQYTAPTNTLAVTNVEVFDSRREQYFKTGFDFVNGIIDLRTIPDESGNEIRVYRKTIYTAPAAQTETDMPDDLIELLMFRVTSLTALMLMSGDVDVDRFKEIAGMYDKLYNNKVSFLFKLGIKKNG